MTELSPDTQKTLDCLRKVAADTLERKRRLGHYAVIWRDGKPVLTGFDAPSATSLYIDKKTQAHGLFQAIFRVNRLDGDNKEYGYIVDYKDLFKSLEGAITDYTSGAFEKYDADDVAGLLSDRIEKGRDRLEDLREQVKALLGNETETRSRW